jgi:hypothetical protein
MTEAALIGVVTVTYNSGKDIETFLSCAFGQTHARFILYCVENASQDQTRQLLESCKEERLRVILNDSNCGVAEGNNQGIRAALRDGCSLVLLINNDVTFEPNFIADLVAGMEHFHADMVCPKMLYFDPPHLIWAAGGTLQPWLGYRSKHFGGEAVDDGSYDEPKRITYVPTCCVLMTRATIDKVGLMDPLYFVYVDDTDFMYRAYKAGIFLMYLPSVRLMHKVGGATGGKGSPFTVRYCTRNRVYYLLKHLGLLRGLPFLLLYQAYFFFCFFLRNDKWPDLVYRQRSFFEGFEVYKRYKFQRSARIVSASR